MSLRAAWLVAWVLIGALTGPARAGGDAAPAAEGEAVQRCAEHAADRVQAHYDALRDMRARFRQTTRSVAFAGGSGEAESAQGEVFFAKPGRMRWVYEGPERHLVVSDGQTLWIYDELAGEVQVLPVGRAFLSGAAVQFLLGKGRLRESFRVEARACDARRARLHLTPRKEATYQWLELEVELPGGRILETEVADLFGNRTRVQLSKVRENLGLSADLFHLDPPPGAQVIEIAPGSP